jgi:nitric oxide reductase subunit B
MISMTLAIAVAGVAQVVLERRSGMDFLAVQKELEPHFIGMILAATLFTTGMLAYVTIFIRYGLPNMEMFGKSVYGTVHEAADGEPSASGDAPAPTTA